MKIKEKKVAVLVEDLYQELEVWYPILRLREAGVKVIVVGTGTKKIYLSKLGYEVKADIEARKVKDIDGVIIPGGYAPDRLRRYEAVNKLVQDTFHKNRVVAAICHGAWVLVSANVLKGRKATCFYAIKDDVINAGGKYVDREVVVDGNLITSRKPEDLPAFMKAVIKALA
jgi:protease I